MVFSKDPSGSGQHVQKNQLCEKLVLIDQLNGLHAKNQVSTVGFESWREQDHALESLRVDKPLSVEEEIR